MTSPILTLQSAAADALAMLLPSITPLDVLERSEDSPLPAQAGSAVVASFVGATSADLALFLTDDTMLAAAAGTDSPLVSVVDVLRPALEAAAGVLGTGVLGDARIEDATALFSNPETQVFELRSQDRNTGWFGIRVRESGAIGAGAGRPDRSMVGKLGRISNVEMALTVEIGRTRMSVRDVLSLEPGAVIELDRSAGAPADVLLNGRLIAHGEVVVIDQDYGIRITQILDVVESIN